MEGFKYFDSRETVLKHTYTKENGEDKLLKSEVIGVYYLGHTGEIPMKVCVMNNGTMSIKVGGLSVGLNKDAVEDLRAILSQNSVGLAS